MTNTVNEFFRSQYPADWNSAWEMKPCGAGGYGREYNGNREDASTIFPQMVCADGFEMSVQGHFGAYSYPRDDFADSYSQVEIMCVREDAFEDLGRGYDVSDERVYPYVPVEVVERVIAAHGGLALPRPNPHSEAK